MGELISAYEFAKRKNVTPKAVYKRMSKGDITYQIIGKTRYINWEINKNVSFKIKAQDGGLPSSEGC